MHSIKTILIASLSPVIVLVGFATSLVYYQYAVDKEKAVMARFAATESKILPAQIAVPLRTGDLDGVRILCRERLKDHRIQSIRVMDAERRVIFSQDNANRTAGLSVIQPIVHGNKTIGTVQVAFDQSELRHLKRDILTVTSSILFFVSGTAIFVVLLLTRWLITKPIGHVTQILNQLQNEQYDWTVQGTFLKEMHPIVDGLKGLSEKLRERKNKIATQTCSLEEYNQSLLKEIERRKTAESFLEASRKKLQLIIDKSPIGICTVDLQSNIVAANPAYAHMLGYTREELRGMSFFDLTHPDYRPQNREIFLQFSSQQRNGFAIDKVYLRKDGTPIDVSLYAIMIEDHAAGTQFGIAFVEDITRQKHAQKELMQSKQFIESVLNGIVDPVFVKDQQHRWIMLNDAFCRMIGHPSHEMQGKTDYEVFSREQADNFREGDKTVLNSNEPYIRDEDITINDQTRIFAVAKSTFTNPITGERNIVATLRDVTDARRTEEQLRQAQKMESVGRLAGGVAHDFNNMLGVILGHTDMILDHPELLPPVRAALTEVRKAAQRSAEMTRQLLAFARKQTMAPEVLDINTMVEGMLKIIKRLIGEDVHLDWEPGAHTWPIKMDPSQVDQILVNLCVNARDAINGVGKVTIATDNATFDEAHCKHHADCKPGEYVLLAVRDNGNGMPPETVDKIFEPFFTTKQLGKGTGLGLATVHGIVMQNNGFISVDSKPGKGTSFKIYLPRHAGPSREVSPPDHLKTTARGHETILVVEDEPAILHMVTEMLQGIGYTILPAETPSQAIPLAQSHQGTIDLLLTDVVMPAMNGRELSVHIKALYPQVKCLFMSGYTANIIAKQGVLDKGVHFIQKPFSIQNLASKLRELLDTGQHNHPET